MYEQNNHSPFWQPQNVVCREFADTVGEIIGRGGWVKVLCRVV